MYYVWYSKNGFNEIASGIVSEPEAGIRRLGCKLYINRLYIVFIIVMITTHALSRQGNYKIQSSLNLNRLKDDEKDMLIQWFWFHGRWTILRFLRKLRIHIYYDNVSFKLTFCLYLLYILSHWLSGIEGLLALSSPAKIMKLRISYEYKEGTQIISKFVSLILCLIYIFVF